MLQRLHCTCIFYVASTLDSSVTLKPQKLEGKENVVEERYKQKVPTSSAK